MNLFITAGFLYTSVASAFAPPSKTIWRTSLQSSLGDEIRSSQSIFDNIAYTSRSTSHNTEHNSGYAPISQSTGQVGTYGVIGETFHRNVPIDYNSSKSAKPVFVPHSSTGAGYAPMSNASPNYYYRHVPTDYNACKSFTISQHELEYFQKDASKQQFTPHSSTGAGGSTMSTSAQYHYAPSDYNSCKSFSVSEHQITHYHNDERAAYSKTNTQTFSDRRIIDLNSKAAAFVPHSSTGAGGAPMSANSPLYQNGRVERSG